MVTRTIKADAKLDPLVQSLYNIQRSITGMNSWWKYGPTTSVDLLGNIEFIRQVLTTIGEELEIIIEEVRED